MISSRPANPMEGSALELEDPIEDAISRARFAPRSNNLLISSWDSVLRLYDADAGVLRFGASSDGALLDCCFEDESAALSASSDGYIRRYDFSSETQLEVGKHDDSVTCIDHSAETGQFISAGLDKKLMFWDKHMKNGNSGCSKAVNLDVWSISLCHIYLLAAGGKMISVYDLRNLRGPVQIKESSMNYQIRCVRSLSTYRGYAMGSVDGCVGIEYLDPSNSCEMGCIFRCHPKSKSGRCHLVTINDIECHPCSNTFATGDSEGYTIIWDLQSKKRLCELQRYSCGVSSLSYNHNGQLLAVSSSYTYEEANEVEQPQIFIHAMEKLAIPSFDCSD